MTQYYLGANRGNSLRMNSGAIDTTTNTNTAAAQAAAVIAEFDIAFGTGTDNLATLLGSAVVYSGTSHQFSGTMSASATVTAVQGAALYALVNTAMTALLAVSVGTGDDMELRWDGTKNLTRMDLREFTEQMEYAIESNELSAALPA